jgi:hypothetical protein
MVQGTLSDANITGQVQILVQILQSSAWREIWDFLELSVASFENLGIEISAPDDMVWHKCQEANLVLITGNRNQDGSSSLEETIRIYNAPDSLPVFTLSQPNRIRQSKAYANRVVERLLERLLEIDVSRGAGRIFLP